MLKKQQGEIIHKNNYLQKNQQIKKKKEKKQIIKLEEIQC